MLLRGRSGSGSRLFSRSPRVLLGDESIGLGSRLFSDSHTSARRVKQETAQNSVGGGGECGRVRFSGCKGVVSISSAFCGRDGGGSFNCRWWRNGNGGVGLIDRIFFFGLLLLRIALG